MLSGFLARIFRFGFFLFAYKTGWWCIRLSDFFFPTVTPNHLIVSFPDVLCSWCNSRKPQVLPNLKALEGGSAGVRWMFVATKVPQAL